MLTWLITRSKLNNQPNTIKDLEEGCSGNLGPYSQNRLPHPYLTQNSVYLPNPEIGKMIEELRN
jgi:hypothetical protein